MGRARKNAEQPTSEMQPEADATRTSDGKGKPETAAIRVSKDIAEMLGTISSIRHETIAEIISDALRPIVRELYAQALKEAATKLNVK